MCVHLGESLYCQVSAVYRDTTRPAGTYQIIWQVLTIALPQKGSLSFLLTSVVWLAALVVAVLLPSMPAVAAVLAPPGNRMGSIQKEVAVRIIAWEKASKYFFVEPRQRMQSQATNHGLREN